MKLSMIMAFAGNGLIGINNTIPWKCSTDMKNFRNVTIGTGNNAVVMGRKTWESLPGDKGLPGRLNVVISSTLRELDGALVYPTVDAALADLKTKQLTDVYLIGGQGIFQHYAKCDEMWLTYIHEEVKIPEGSDPVFCNPVVAHDVWFNAGQTVHADCTITRFLKR